MSEELNLVYDSIDKANQHETALTRRKLVGAAAGAIGGLGLLGIPDIVKAGGGGPGNTPENILAAAATVEVLATIVNTVGPEKVNLDPVVRRNVRSAAREELIHYDVLTGPLGAKAITKKIWVPNSVFRSQRNLLNVLEVGDQIFINAYLIGTTAFGNAGLGKFARVTGEFMGAEAVHRALARQALGKLGNDRAFMQYTFTNIFRAVSLLEGAGFGFGKRGRGPGQFYELDRVRRRTPNPGGVNTRSPK